MPGSFSVSKYIFIPLSGFHHLQGYASMSKDWATRSNVWQADTKLLLSRALAQGWKLGIGGETSGRLSLITRPADTDGYGQSRGSNPLDSTQWVSYDPTHGQTTVIGRKKLEGDSGSKVEFKFVAQNVGKNFRHMRIEFSFFWETARAVAVSNRTLAVSFTW